jgi:DNA polymerase-3 subunit epsilon
MGIQTQVNWLGKSGGSSNSELKLNWREVNYCVIDLETTGLDLKNDEIISIGAVQIQSGRVISEANYYQQVRPKQIPSPSSIQIHGIRPVDLEGAPSIGEVLPEFAERIRGRVVVAHAAWVENAFLKDYLQDLHVDLSWRLIDTAGLARISNAVNEDLDHEPSLEHLARSLDLPVYSPHHALGDALTTAIIFLALATKLERAKREKDGSNLSLKQLLKMSEKSSRTPW